MYNVMSIVGVHIILAQLAIIVLLDKTPSNVLWGKSSLGSWYMQDCSYSS